MKSASMIRAAALLAAALALAGCILLPEDTWDHVTLNQESVGANSPDKLHAGDVVRVRNEQGSSNVFRVTELRQNAFVGVAQDEKTYLVAYNSLSQMEIKRKELVMHGAHGFRAFP